ncbi:MAG: hypothetical protein KBT03_10270 [Bacteroidales bacterium]|nr:hypothetical protein [Candidatus Scybalousia scybalohippi]
MKNTYSVDLLIIDEVHCTASPTNILIYQTVNYKYLLGLTATFERLDGRHELLLKYMTVCDTITTEEAVKNNWLSPYRNYKVLLKVDLTQYNEWNTKFHSMFSFFNFDFKLAMGCIQDKRVAAKFARMIGKSDKEVRGYAANWMSLLRKRKSFVMSHPYKFEIANKILDARSDKKCIAFSATIKDAEKFKSKGALILHSKQRKKENEAVMAVFNSRPNGILSTSKCADAGVDIKGLSVGIILSGDSSKTRTTQRVGRIIRFEEGKISEMFTLVVAGTVEETWFNNSNTNKQYITINEDQLDIILNGGEISSRPRTGIEDMKNRY